MPNWCLNLLKVEGKPNEVLKFMELSIVESKDNSNQDVSGFKVFTMSGILPLPTELSETTTLILQGDEKSKVEIEKKKQSLRETYGYDNCRDWQINMWGTKWDADTINIYSGRRWSHYLCILYNTAWSPNIPWVKYAATKFPKLKFYLSFEEPSCDFCGVLICKGSKVIKEVTGQVEWQDDDGREVYYDDAKGLYCYCDTDEVIDNEDFMPNSINPYSKPKYIFG